MSRMTRSLTEDCIVTNPDASARRRSLYLSSIGQNVIPQIPNEVPMSQSFCMGQDVIPNDIPMSQSFCFGDSHQQRRASCFVPAPDAIVTQRNASRDFFKRRSATFVNEELNDRCNQNGVVMRRRVNQGLRPQRLSLCTLPEVEGKGIQNALDFY